MSRAELRRINKALNKKPPNYSSYTFTPQQLEAFKEREREAAHKEAYEKMRKDYAKLARDTFKLMLCIPTNVLIADYWTKTAERRIPKFVDDCMDTYKAYTDGLIDMAEMQTMTEKFAKIKLFNDDSPIGKAYRDTSDLSKEYDLSEE